MKKIHFRMADDWVALYIDGKLVYQHHSIPVIELAQLLGHNPTWEYLDEEDPEFPEELADDKK